MPSPNEFGPLFCSLEADRAIQPKKAALREKVYQFIQSRASYGATDEEGQEALGMPGNTYRPRRKELEEAGRIGEAWGGMTRLTRAGRKATVWFGWQYVTSDPPGKPNVVSAPPRAPEP